NNEKIAVGVQGAEHALHTSQWLTSRGHVHWVEVKPPTITNNKYASMLTQSYSKPYSHPLWDRGITGANQIIGVGDTGVDYYHCFFYDEQNPQPPFTKLIRADNQANHRKFAAFWEYMDRIDSPTGHGTHVSGTASGAANTKLSDPILSEYNSPAFGSKLAFADCGCDTDGGCSCPEDTQCECDLKADKKCQKRFGVVYLPLDLNSDYFSWFYSKGARVVSNSWGTGYYRDFSMGYSTTTAEVDKFVWNNKDFLPFFAAGNSGGQYGYASLTSESEAKNGLAIGASQSCLESFMDAANRTDYSQTIDMIKVQIYQYYCVDSLAGSADAADQSKVALCEEAKKFSTVEDCCNEQGACKGSTSATCCGSQKFNAAFPNIGYRCCPRCIDMEMANQPTHFSSSNLALFTARGPTLDGRIKPDIVTVGDKIMSGLSRGTTEANKCDRSMSATSQLLKHEGTSMACPVAAANAILIRQFYQDGYYGNTKPVASSGFSPSAALVKATMIHSARVLDGLIYLMSKHVWWPLQYKLGHRFQLRQGYHQGFGRIELNNVLSPTAGLYLPNLGKDKDISTGQQHGYCVQLKSALSTFKATLVWTDFPSAPNAQINLVNDLDLIVVMPDGTRYYGNGKYSPVMSAREEADYLNNVEQFSMDNATAGLYNVIVRGASVPQGPQPYAIVISGGGIAQSTNCFPFSADLTPELTTYKNYAYAFGIIILVVLPSLLLISTYFYLQYRTVTTGRGGYKMSAMAQTSSGHQLITDSDNLELKTLRSEMPEESIFDDEDDDDRVGSDNARAGLMMRERL
ncbi:ABC transporter-peptidase tagC, partial [Acrasis kona]